MGRSAATARTAAALGLAWLALGCGRSEVPAAASPAADFPAAVEEAAQRAVEALAGRDLDALADLVHPVDGVRFSPYATVDPRRDVVLSPAELRNAGDDPTPLLWGEYDGTGDPIRLSFDEYYRRFVYGADFAASDQVARDRRLGYADLSFEAERNY